MKIIHITDSHGTAKGPESRQDVYYLSFLKKIYELQHVVKHENIDYIIHTGDLFHNARPSDKFTGQVAEFIKNMGIPFYVVPGNHDIEGYTTATIDQTKLGLLAKAGVITILDRDNPLLLIGHHGEEEYTVAVSGQEYYAHIDEGNMRDFEMQQDEADLNILAIHGYLTNTPQHPDIKCTMCKDIVSDADIILAGHYHRQFEWSDGQNLDIFNPGSMMRVEQTEYNRTHTPQYGILNIDLNDKGYLEWDYSFHEFKIAEPSEVVFDYGSKYKTKHASITLEGFKNSIANTMAGVSTTNYDVSKIISDLCTTAQLDATITSKALDIYNDALQNAPDLFEAKQGFIPAQYTKKIVKVTLENFQAHEHSEIEFHNGLNIIVGESNNGKTSILRAIMWVVDNQPLGTDFIMAGKDECSVTIEYDDGTWIQRGRTLKDTGYYKVKYIDDNGKYQIQEYRGFTNAIPVDVDNVHQMPKVNITKDIETHLNVLSQLDTPFLLTESPMVKASAIGRITGTHVIDAGVKESNKTILSNKKTAKVHEETIQEKQNKLVSLPDLGTLTKFATIYDNLVKYLVKQQTRMEHVEKSIMSISQLTNNIQNVTNKLNELQILRSISGIVYSALDKLQFVQTVNGKQFSLTNINENITNNEKIIKQNAFLVALYPIVNKATGLERSCYMLEEKMQHINNIQRQEKTLISHVSTLNEYSSLAKSIQVYCKILYDYILKVNPNMEAIDVLSFKQTETVSMIANIKKEIANTKRKITIEQNKKNKFIVDNGLCPCCGQSITDKCVDSITLFMENIGG